MLVHVFMQDAPYLQNRLRVFLHTVPRWDDFFRLRLRQMGAQIRHHSIAAFFQFLIGTELANDGVIGYAIGNLQLLAGHDEWVFFVQIVYAVGHQNPALLQTG